MTPPSIAKIGSNEILLVNRIEPNEVQKLVTAYGSRDQPPPVVVATYNGRYLAVTGSHRLTALAKLIEDGNLEPSIAWSEHVLLIDGSELAVADTKCRDALNWLESYCLSPVEPIGLDAAVHAEKYMKVCGTLLRACSSSHVKDALRSDAGAGFFG